MKNLIQRTLAIAALSLVALGATACKTHTSKTNSNFPWHWGGGSSDHIEPIPDVYEPINTDDITDLSPVEPPPEPRVSTRATPTRPAPSTRAPSLTIPGAPINPPGPGRLAGQVGFAWDYDFTLTENVGVDGFYLYSGPDKTPFAWTAKDKFASKALTQSLTFPATGKWKVLVTAYDTGPDGEVESDPSNTVTATVTVPPRPPANLR